MYLSRQNTHLLMWLSLPFLLGIVALLFLSALTATMAQVSDGGGGMGAGPCFAATPTTAATNTVSASPSVPTTAPPVLSTPGTTASSVAAGSSSGMQGSCIPASGYGAAVVQWARAMANALSVNPACGSLISFPNCYYSWYNSTFPQAVIDYGEQVCPGCVEWANGTYQCVSFVRGAYSQVYPMRLTANAFDLWALYQGQPGWSEIPSAAAPFSARSIPEPGDVMVFKDAGVGHAAIVMSVTLPVGQGTNGSIVFANSNSISPYSTMPLLPDLTVDASSWPGYTVWGYIRPQSRIPPQNGVGHAQLDLNSSHVYSASATEAVVSHAHSFPPAALSGLSTLFEREHDSLLSLLVREEARFRRSIMPSVLASSGTLTDSVLRIGLQPLYGQGLHIFNRVMTFMNARPSQVVKALT